MSQRLSKPFWPPAFASQAPPAIILAVLRRFRGPALFGGPRPSSRQGVPFWPSGLTLRSSGRLRRRLPWPLIGESVFRILLVALLAFGAWKGYEKYQSQRTAEQFQGISQEIDISNNSSRRNRSIDITPKFQCDGRTHCSQMTSCEEATFFLKNCPGTKMDGNNDGVPCEQQWCK